MKISPQYWRVIGGKLDEDDSLTLNEQMKTTVKNQSFWQSVKAKECVKPCSANGEKNSYDFCLPEKAVTLELIQLEALTVPENVQGNFSREQTIIAEDNVNLCAEVT